MNQMIFLNGKQVEVIAYFEFESIKTRYLIYCNPGDSTTIYLGEVLIQDGVFELQPIRKMYSFLLIIYNNKCNTRKDKIKSS